MAYQQPTISAHSLDKVVTRYNRLYAVLIVLGIIALLLSGAFIYLKVQSRISSIQALGSKYNISQLLAVDSSGKIVATTFTNYPDSTQGLLVSYDSGSHFQKVEWPANVAIKGDYHYFQDIFIANNQHTIVAFSGGTVYLHTKEADSVIQIHLNRFPGLNSFEAAGYFQKPNSDSIFFYNPYSEVYGFNVSKPDSIARFTLMFDSHRHSTVVAAMMDANRSVIFTGNNFEDNVNAGVYINARLKMDSAFAVKDYNNLPALNSSAKSDTNKVKPDTIAVSVKKTDSVPIINVKPKPQKKSDASQNVVKPTANTQAIKPKGAIRKGNSKAGPVSNGTKYSKDSIPAFDPKQQSMPNNLKAN